MASFKQKKISCGQTLGDKINKKRLEHNFSLTELSSQLKIQSKYLKALEEGNYQSLPGDVYVKSWLKLCAEALELNYRELVADYKLEKNLSSKFKALPEDFKARQKRFIFWKIINPRNLKIAGLALGILALLGYLGWEINGIIAPPKVVIFEPEQNLRTRENSLVISGQTKPEVELKINNEKVLLNEDGSFYQEINLIVGLNNLQISAKKKHSKTSIYELLILRESVE
ncbi:MAG: helix-turn-helix domain-containing protein [Patescibacteria group bacterium]|nr:helix-turn-helix domain-containing protein [Patescibacteria group bacterium]